MHFKDNPGSGRLVRPGQEDLLGVSQEKVVWEAVLLGRAHDEMMAAHMPSSAVLKILADRASYERPVMLTGPAGKSK